jgi:hypothetical protein
LFSIYYGLGKTEAAELFILDLDGRSGGGHLEKQNLLIQLYALDWWSGVTLYPYN